MKILVTITTMYGILLKSRELYYHNNSYFTLVHVYFLSKDLCYIIKNNLECLAYYYFQILIVKGIAEILLHKAFQDAL